MNKRTCIVYSLILAMLCLAVCPTFNVATSFADDSKAKSQAQASDREIATLEDYTPNQSVINSLAADSTSTDTISTETSLPRTGDSAILIVVGILSLVGSLIGLAFIAKMKRKGAPRISYPDI